ncbi:hypothetical protein BOX15_Mlig030458g2, partial [Macrostomum lignano]
RSYLLRAKGKSVIKFKPSKSSKLCWQKSEIYQAMAKTRAKFDKMWRIWYAILVLALNAFLLYSAFQRYASFRAKALREQWDMSPMNFYLAMMILTVFLLPFFLYAALAKTANYAEDGVQIGRDRDCLRVAIAETSSGAGAQATVGTCMSRLRRHFMPYTCLLHVLTAFCLLIPMPVLEAAEIHHAKRPSDEIWRTNLDFIYHPKASATNSVCPEVFNLMLALAILLVRYPSTFWFSNRAFAFMFSVILCVCGLHIVLSYEATSVLFKASMSNDVVTQVNLLPPAIIALHSIGDLLLLVANIAFFEFGYAQMLSNLRKYRNYLQLEASSSVSDRSISSCNDETPCWLNYAPHLAGILLMVVAVLCKAPVLWDWVGLYRVHQQPAMLAAVVSGGIYLSLWVSVWFLLGFKANWKFNIRLELEFPGKIHQPQHQQRQRSNSDFGSMKRGGSSQYMYLQSRGNGEAISMIPTISEQVDIASENSYTVGLGGSNAGGGTLERQQHSGLVKYQQMRRSSTQSSASQFSGVCGGSLQRSASTASRRGGLGSGAGGPAASTLQGGNRVTFKDTLQMHEAIPGSPNASSSDSGIDSSRVPQGIQMSSIDDPYARVNKLPKQQQQQQQQQHRAPSRQSNYDDYQMFGSLFTQQTPPLPAHQQQQMVPERDYYTRQELQELVGHGNHGDIYGRLGGGVGDFDPYGTSALYTHHEAPELQLQQPEAQPDILLSKSPYSSLSRQAAAKMTADHAYRGSYSSLPPPPVADLADHVDGLCSQV